MYWGNRIAAGVILGAGTQTIAASFINKWVNIEGQGSIILDFK